MALPATQIRRGMVLVFDGDPCRVLEFRHHTPGNLRAMVQAKLKNLRTGNSFEHRFRAADTIEKASMETHDLEFMYKGGDTYHFMNTENYDQLEIDSEVLGANAQWMELRAGRSRSRSGAQLVARRSPKEAVGGSSSSGPVTTSANCELDGYPAEWLLALSSRGLGRGPLKAQTRVRIPLALLIGWES